MTEIERMRTAFFRKTRRMVIVLYLCLGVAAAVLAAVAAVLDTVDGILGIVVGLAAGVVVFALSPLIPVTARGARLLVVLAPVAGIVVARSLDPSALGSDAFFAGVFAGFLAGTIVGVAAIRRRLAHDDELLLRQKGLGFDPENPSRWLRG